MAENSKIEWTDHTFNPWIGCQRVSQGCLHCYAETLMDTRYGKVQWGPQGERLRTSETYWKQPLKWNREAAQQGRRARVFCASLSDVFEFHPGLAVIRTDLWQLIEATPNLDWLLLTKRPENVLFMVPFAWTKNWPAHVWIGTSVEDQKTADKRIPELLKVPAAIRFLSCEPLLGPVDLSSWLGIKEKEDVPSKHGRLDLSPDREWGVADRQSRANLESEITSLESLGKLHDGNTDPTEESRTRHRGILSDTGNGRRDKTKRSGSQVGMETFQGGDTRRDDDQPQEREKEIQSPGQSGTGDLFGADSTCASRPESGSDRPEWREERNGKTDDFGGQRNPRTESYGGDVETDSKRLRSDFPDNLQDSEGRPTISWIIAGGESGPDARPMHPHWARSLRDQCVSANVAFFFKQHGEYIARKQLTPEQLANVPNAAYVNALPIEGDQVYRVGKKAAGRLLDGREWSQFPTDQLFKSDDAELDALWPSMPDLTDGVDLFLEKYGEPTGE